MNRSLPLSMVLTDLVDGRVSPDDPLAVVGSGEHDPFPGDDLRGGASP